MTCVDGFVYCDGGGCDAQMTVKDSSRWSRSGDEDFCPEHTVAPLDSDERARELGERARRLCGCWQCLRKRRGYAIHVEHPHTCLALGWLEHLLREVRQ